MGIVTGDDGLDQGEQAAGPAAEDPARPRTRAAKASEAQSKHLHAIQYKGGVITQPTMNLADFDKNNIPLAGRLMHGRTARYITYYLKNRKNYTINLPSGYLGEGLDFVGNRGE